MNTECKMIWFLIISFLLKASPKTFHGTWGLSRGSGLGYPHAPCKSSCLHSHSMLENEMLVGVKKFIPPIFIERLLCARHRRVSSSRSHYKLGKGAAVEAVTKWHWAPMERPWSALFSCATFSYQAHRWEWLPFLEHLPCTHALWVPST